MAESALAPTVAPDAKAQRAPRYAFVDWYRGLACVLMFQTHAYDAWTAGASRNNEFWWASRHLGGFPSRLFLLLAGVSLAIRFDADARRGVSPRVSRKGAALRGLEVLGLGYLFRLFEWVLGGAGLSYASDIIRIDILNCIGVSLAITAYVATPRDLEPRRWPWRPIILALAIVFLTPFAEAFRFPAWAPRFLTSYVAGEKPMAFFPLFPWLAYVLAGAAAGIIWIRFAREDRLGHAITWTVGLGALMSLGGQLARRSDMALYSFGDNQPIPTSPTAFFYRTGVCLVGVGLAYLATRKARPTFSAMRQLGRTSLLVYWIHVELVYGHLSDFIKQRLGLIPATIGLVLLTLAMLGLSWLRTERFPSWREGIASRMRKTLA